MKAKLSFGKENGISQKMFDVKKFYTWVTEWAANGHEQIMPGDIIVQPSNFKFLVYKVSSDKNEIWIWDMQRNACFRSAPRLHDSEIVIRNGKGYCK